MQKEQSLVFMLTPNQWPEHHFKPAKPGHQMICLKKPGTNYEFADLLHRDGRYYFEPENNRAPREGGPELPEILVQEGWLVD